MSRAVGIIRCFLKLKEWRGTERIVFGGGLRGSRVGELAVGRTAVLLHADAVKVDLLPIRHDPDEAGLIGGAHLAPSWIFAGHDSIQAMDIGGTNARVGIVALNLKRAANLSRAAVTHSETWRHRDGKPTRDQAVERLASMLNAHGYFRHSGYIAARPTRKPLYFLMSCRQPTPTIWQLSSTQLLSGLAAPSALPRKR